MVDLDLAIELAEACAAVYAEKLAVGISKASNGREIIAFRGTANLLDWIRDANYPQVEFHGAKVHRGFLHDYQACAPLIKLRGRQPPYITGHSLGAAAASLCAIDKDPEATVITFGSPRVGDLDFLERYCTCGLQQRSWRIYNLQDVVPHLPPERIPDPFRLTIDHFEHVGMGFPLTFKGEGGGVFGPAHAITNYIKALKNKRKVA